MTTEFNAGIPSSPMASTQLAAMARLDRLESYLLSDPNNRVLLVDAFSTALTGFAWDRAQFHLRHARALEPDNLEWALREVDLWLAQSKFSEARAALDQLQHLTPVPRAFSDAVLHNLAYVDFQERDYAASVARLAGRLGVATSGGEGDASSGADASTTVEMQQLWLRSLHRTGELTRAVEWTKALVASSRAQAQVVGIASLIALDAGDMVAALQWSESALKQAGPNDRPMEALVTQASLALGARDAGRASSLASAALSFNPNDGRAWSARAFADLLAGQLQQARSHFAKALSTMPEHIGTWHGQAWTELLLQDLDAAQSSFENALALDHNFAESHGGLAVVLALKKTTTAAQDHIERAMRLDRRNLSGRYAQSILSGEVQDAVTLQRLAQRLLSDRAAPLGGSIYDGLVHLWATAGGASGPAEAASSTGNPGQTS